MNTNAFSHSPQREFLAMLPTPFYKMTRLSQKYGASLWVKRDDLTGAAESGNKIRKLEFLAADALSKGADIILTCGGEQSNHSRATAIVARRLGMDVHLVLRRTSEGPSGNLLLDMILGATVRWVTPEEYEHHEEILLEEADKLKGYGRKPYIVPEGGSNSLGIWGYVLAAEEAHRQADEKSMSLDYIIVPSGSGGTYAGLWLGSRMLGKETKIVAITAGPDVEKQKKHIEKITDEFIERYAPDLKLDKSEIFLVDGFWREGYGVIDEELARFIMDFGKEEGIILDPTYTGKAFLGALTMIEQEKLPKDKNILLWHTGGIFGLFTKGQFFREIYHSGARVK
ncbi:D-cysteine desulfhydrase family protein [bacterium]|nr:D-cysteine desulfhydrase family protein [bacterium]